MTVQTLKGLRANADLTQSEAAEKLGISTPTLINWEKAKTFPDVPQIQKIEKLYGVPYGDINFYAKSSV